MFRVVFNCIVIYLYSFYMYLFKCVLPYESDEAVILCHVQAMQTINPEGLQKNVFGTTAAFTDELSQKRQTTNATSNISWSRTINVVDAASTY